MIDDFEDGNPASLAVDGRAGGWYPYNDETPGAAQLLELVIDDSAPAPGNGVLHTTGSGFTTFSGFGLGLRWTETGSESCYYDASYYSGVTFWARGSASLRVTLQNPSVRSVGSGGTCPNSEVCFDAHGLGVTIDAEWRQYRIDFESVTQAGYGLAVGAFRPQRLAAIEFQLGAGTTYEMWLDDVAFVRRGAPDGGGLIHDSGTNALDAAAPADAAPDGGE
jgi:hypothetical protein